MAIELNSFSAVSSVVRPCNIPFLKSHRENEYSSIILIRVEVHGVEVVMYFFFTCG